MKRWNTLFFLEEGMMQCQLMMAVTVILTEEPELAV